MCRADHRHVDLFSKQHTQHRPAGERYTGKVRPALCASGGRYALQSVAEVYESAREEALKSGAYLELVNSDTMTDYTLEDYLKVSIASKVDGIIMQPTGSRKYATLSTRRRKTASRW